MRLNLTLSCLLVLAGFGANAQSDQVVLNLSKAKFDWMVAKNYDSLNRLMDEKMEYIHSNGWVQTKNEVIEDFKSGKVSYNKMTVKETHARSYGNTVIVEGLGTFEGTNEGKTFTLELRYSEVYIKSGRQWIWVLRHANRMP